MAGAQGFEPRVAVLETAGLPINRHSYTWSQWVDSNYRPPNYKLDALGR